MSADDGIFITTEPLGTSNAPPPIKPEPATISTLTPLKTKLPVLIGKDFILEPSKYTNLF